MRRVLQIALLIGLIAAGWWGWRTFFPGPERQVRRQMAALEELVSFKANEGNLARLANARQLASLFTEDVRIRVDVRGGPRGELRGRESIFNAALGARSALGSLTVKFLDVVVTISPDKQAATVEATGRATQPGIRDFVVQELRFRFKRTDEGWLICEVETVRTLTQRGNEGDLRA